MQICTKYRKQLNEEILNEAKEQIHNYFMYRYTDHTVFVYAGSNGGRKTDGANTQHRRNGNAAG